MKTKEKNAIGILHIRISFNNTLLTFCDSTGNCLAWFSAGSLNLKAGRKSSVYAVQVCIEKIILKVKSCGYKALSIRVSGLGIGRKFILRSIKKLGVKVISLEDFTSRPHNGCRSKNKRRL
jgi:small subunit ribosomal protein S11